MLAAIGGAICLVAAIGLIRIFKARRMRTTNLAMRNYVRRSY